MSKIIDTQTVNGVTLHIAEIDTKRWGVSNKEIAEAFGKSEATIRGQKASGDYIENVHYTCVPSANAGETVGFGGNSTRTLWTKKGIIRLAFKLENNEKTIKVMDWVEDYVVTGGDKKPLTKIQMLAEMAASMAQQEQELLVTKKVADDALGLAEKHDYIIENNKSKEVIPKQGYYSITTLQNKLAYKFQKAHIKGILFDTQTSKKIRSHQCNKYIEQTLSYETYQAYSIVDVESVIDDITSTGIRVLNKNDSPSLKMKSPLYGQEYRYPLKSK